MTFGVMPSREQYDAGYDHALSEGNVDGRFHFGNDPRMGTDSLSREELWKELQKAHAEYESDCPDGEPVAEFEASREAAGDWMSSVLYSLDIEWI